MFLRQCSSDILRPGTQMSTQFEKKDHEFTENKNRYTNGTQLAFLGSLFASLTKDKEKAGELDLSASPAFVEHRRFELLTPTLPERQIIFSGFFCLCETLVISGLLAFFLCPALWGIFKLFTNPVHIRYTKTASKELMTLFFSVHKKAEVR